MFQIPKQDLYISAHLQENDIITKVELRHFLPIRGHHVTSVAPNGMPGPLNMKAFTKTTMPMSSSYSDIA